MFSVADVFVQIGVQGVSAVSSALNSVKGWLSALGQSAASAINGMAGTGGVIGNLAKALQGLGQMGSGASMILQGLGSILASTVPLALAIGQAFYNVSNVLLGAMPEKLIAGFSSAAAAIKNAFVAQFGNLASLLSAKFAQLGTVITNALAPVTAKLGQVFATLVTLAANTAAAMGIKFGQLAPKIKAAWNVIKATAVSAAQATAKAFADQFAAIGNLIATKLAPLATKLGPAFGVIKTNAQFAASVIKTGLTDALAKLPTIIQGVVKAFQGLKNVVVGLGSAIKSALGPVAAKAMNAVTTAASAAAKAVKGVYNVAVGTATAIKSVYAALMGPVGVVFSFVSGGLSSLIGLAKKLGSALMSAIATPFRLLKNFIFSTQGMLTALVGTLSAAAVGRYIVDVTADAEDAAVSFRVMLGSAEKAVEMLRQIQDLADHTPLELPEVRQGARSLLAMGVAGNEVVTRLRRIGDVAQGIQVPFNDLVAIYGKIYQKNRMTGDEIRQFGRRGIPMVRLLSEQMNVSTEAIYKMAAEGKLHFAEFDAAFQSMTKKGGMFYNMLEERSRTISGRWSTLKDSVRAVATAIGQAVTPAIKQALEYFIQFADWAKTAIQPYKSQIEAMANYVVARIPPLINTLKSALPAVMEAANTAFAVVKAIHGVTDTIISQIMQMVGGTDSIVNGFMRITREIRFAASQWKLFMELAKAYYNNFGRIGTNFLSQLFSDLKANLAHIGNWLWVMVKGIMAYISDKFQLIINHVSEELWGGDFTDANKALEDSANRNAESIGKALAGAFTKAPGFNFKKIFGLDDPDIKKIWDLLLGRRKVFMLEQLVGEKLAGWLQAVKDFFASNSRTDVGNDHANVGDEMAKKRSMQFESLLQYAKNIQQAASPHEKQMEQLAKQQAKDIKDIKENGIKVNNLGDANQGARFAA